ncbi:MAG: metallophosphoesterase [Clostridia bacterium]|nr:metallophosphoesterase [Clostridia bacterium]
MMKKTFALILSLVLLISAAAVPSYGAEEKKLTFGEDGKFRILQINDFQDRDVANEESLAFLNAVLDKYEPDLVVLVGDQLSDHFPGKTVEKLKQAIANQVTPMQERGIPFIFTFGNHDLDHVSTMSAQQQGEYYRSFSYCYANSDGPDAGTYNTLIYSNDGTTPLLNIYMMDTGHWVGTGMNCGVTEEQVEWYKETSNSLKALNGVKVVPSLVFQHVPVKEIHKLLKEVPADTPCALKAKYEDKYYVLDENADWIGDRNVMRETPASEHPTVTTGQYEAWLEQGDIIGAYFGHDHINTFVGRTEDGIVLGYNGGFGFATYGDPGERYAKIFDFDASDVENYTQQNVYYTETVTEEPDEPQEPQEPSEPEEPVKECDCNCHKDGFMGFIWKIVRFFSKLFGANKVCKCGIEHY